jgi:hypothetical protein
MCGARSLRVWRVVFLLAAGCAPTNPLTAGAVDIGHFAEAANAERAAMQRLAGMLTANTRAARYRIVYTYEGRHFGGVVPHVWEYDPQARTLQDTFEASGKLRGRLTDVGREDIQKAAQAAGGYGTLQTLLTRKADRGRARPNGHGQHE